MRRRVRYTPADPVRRVRVLAVKTFLFLEFEKQKQRTKPLLSKRTLYLKLMVAACFQNCVQPEDLVLELLKGKVTCDKKRDTGHFFVRSLKTLADACHRCCTDLKVLRVDRGCAKAATW